MTCILYLIDLTRLGYYQRQREMLTSQETSHMTCQNAQCYGLGGVKTGSV